MKGWLFSLQRAFCLAYIIYSAYSDMKSVESLVFDTNFRISHFVEALKAF